MAKKIRKICQYCGSNNVGREASVEWDVKKQEWVVHSIYDDQFCRDCEVEGDHVIIDEEK